MYRKFALLLTLIIVLSGCDSFQADINPIDSNPIKLSNEEVVILPGVSSYIDLADLFNYSQKATYSVGVWPEKGELHFMEQSILVYTPFESFAEGVDRFSIELYNGDSILIDSDTIKIKVLSDTSEIPCFNGAMEDFYQISITDSLIFNPALNDGICSDSISSYEIKVDSPEFGLIVELGDFNFLYLPTNLIPQTDFFKYSLSLTDLSGKEISSSSWIKIKTFSQTDSSNCDNVFPSKVYELSTEEDTAEYRFQIYFPDDLCDISSWNVKISEAYGGQASVTNDNQFIEFIPDFSDSIASIHYKVEFSEKTLDRHIEIVYIDYDTQDPCPIVVDDEYYFDLGSDSTESNIVYLYPANNDVKCSNSFIIDVLEYPDFGELKLVDSTYFEYIVNEEFAGPKSTKMKYMLCDGKSCDDGYIDITVEK